MTIASNLGFPRIGRRRELKTALESFWDGEADASGLQAAAAALRARHWALQAGRGISHVPCGDFALYDHVLDTACMVGAIPPGYGWSEGPVSLATGFALARGSRGTASEQAAGIVPGLPALEMTKWFDTNYHHLVPLLSAAQRFTLTENRPLTSLREAAAIRLRTRPVLLGPVSFLLLCKTTDGSDPLDLLGRLLPVYATILAELAPRMRRWCKALPRRYCSPAISGRSAPTCLR
jgi:5-methyltetrahydropteroyltriglutamate--homocysteine methyltransferase